MDCSMPSFTMSWSLLKFMSIELKMLSKISSSAITFSFYLQSFPASGSFPVSWLFTSGGESIGASALASILPINIQDWLVWFPCRPRDSQASSPMPQFKSINSSVLSLLYDPTLTSIHDYWKNHSFGYIDLCWHTEQHFNSTIYEDLKQLRWNSITSTSLVCSDAS